MKSSITINTDDSENVMFSICIEDMPVKNLKGLKGLEMSVAEAFVNALELQSGGKYHDDARAKIIQSLLGTE